MKSINRRDFMKRSGGLALVSVAAPTVWAAQPKLALDDPLAIALGYSEDATKVDTQKYPKRAGEQGAKQFCSNCALYAEQADGFGTCTAIPGKLVAGAGWCNAWVPKA
jgi:high potential iron-sulfur protein